MILPLVAELLGRVGRHPAVEGALAALRRGHPVVRLAGLTEPAKALLVAQAALALERPVLWLVSSNAAAEAILEPLRFFYRALSGRAPSEAQMLPALDVLPYEGRSPHAEICAVRAVALWRLASEAARIVLAPVAAAQMRLRNADYFRNRALVLARDMEISLEALLEHLHSVGYVRRELVEAPGQFAVRGGIVDVFSPEAVRPVRIELLGDTVESLREFDPGTQRSVARLERALLLPLSEFPRTSRVVERVWAAVGGAATESEASPADALPGWEFVATELEPPACDLFALAEGAVVVLDEPDGLAEASRNVQNRLRESFVHAHEPARTTTLASVPMAPPETFYLRPEEWEQALACRPRIELVELVLAESGTEPGTLLSQPTPRYRGNVAAFMTDVRGRLARGEQVCISAATPGELERLADLCREYEVAFRLGEMEGEATIGRLAEEAAASPSAVVLIRTPLARGVSFPDLRLTLYGSADLFEPVAPAARRRPQTAAFDADLGELHPGDFVVHVDHGIGQFEGLRQIETDGSRGEFMLLRYAEGARLYVPLARLDLVQKYRTVGNVTPQLDRLGGTAWATRKQRAQKAVNEMAQKLLRLYAERSTVSGHAFSPDTAWQREFDEAFEFEETPDQLRAIEETKRDMERPVPMDRLICGDVGYGKTEVAMRAAFKAVCDSKQVAVLAPTTVLVFQHYETFRRRFAAFPVRVEMLSRFRNARETQRVLDELAAGRVDIVIGTHRLLSRDVRFADLGLLIIDEEQRFGVTHKERLKELRRNVDVLTLTATPIPRTLHMALVGLRDLSVIETPPKDRLAIQTIVAPFHPSLVQSAIEQELARNGQVYFLHNRVETIHEIAALVRRLVPAARVVVGHGQMSERELERVMLTFLRQQADVLVATTIIENGLDIPRVNTILVNHAERFGLAELYQLRGRVGRSNVRAYAYLLVPPGEALSPTARKRLAALREFSELGAGFRIAALDLELRGAGNLLGRQQHGHIHAVGFDLYCRMMERAVAELKGQPVAPERRTTFHLGLEIRIPPEYIPSEALRLRVYRRIAALASAAERDELQRELEDRFGPVPRPVENLLDSAVLKAVAERLAVAAVERRGDRIAVRFHEQTPVEPRRIVELVRRGNGLRLDPAGVLWLATERGGSNPARQLTNLLLQLQPER
jgi:transcription-repair coupling factor (superfamily II helicase)